MNIKSWLLLNVIGFVISTSTFVFEVLIISELDRILLSDYVLSEKAFDALMNVKWALGFMMCSAVLASVLGILGTLISEPRRANQSTVKTSVPNK